MRLVIEIPKPWSVQVVAREGGEPGPEEIVTDRQDWVQGLSEAMLNGARAWLHGAGLDTVPTLHIDPVIVPKDDEDVPF